MWSLASVISPGTSSLRQIVGVSSISEMRSCTAVLTDLRRDSAAMPGRLGEGRIPSSGVGPNQMITVGPNQVDISSRLHSLISEVAPGGIAKEMYVSDAEALLAKVSPASPAQQMRVDLILELLDDVRRLDTQTKGSHRRIRLAVKASATSVTEVYGVGPVHAASLIGYSGDIARLANRDAYASYNGTAPTEFSSGGRTVHRLSMRGSRRLNNTLHMAAVTQIRNPGTEGRIYFERKVVEGKTKKKALRSLKRQISNAVYRQLLLDAQ